METKTDITRAIFGLEEIPEFMHELWEPSIELRWLTQQQIAELVGLRDEEEFIDHPQEWCEETQSYLEPEGDRWDVQRAYVKARGAILELQKAVQKFEEDRRVVE